MPNPFSLLFVASTERSIPTSALSALPTVSVTCMYHNKYVPSKSSKSAFSSLPTTFGNLSIAS